MLCFPLLPSLEQLSVLRVSLDLSLTPDISSKSHVNHDNRRAPHIETSRVILSLLQEHLRCRVWLAATHARLAQADFGAHALATLAASFSEAGVVASEDFGDTKVGDLELAVFGDEKVLEFDVAVGNTVAVQIVDSLHKLLE